MSANDNDSATHKWVRELVATEIANQPKKAFEAAKAAASSGGKSAAFYTLAVIVIILFGVGSGYAAQLSKDLENLQGNANQTVGSWADTKRKNLTPTLFTICFGFLGLGIVISLMTGMETVFLQSQGKIALGVAVFSLLMSIMIYVIAIYTRTVPKN
jgi:hypothetical protein